MYAITAALHETGAFIAPITCIVIVKVVGPQRGSGFHFSIDMPNLLAKLRKNLCNFLFAKDILQYFLDGSCYFGVGCGVEMVTIDWQKLIPNQP
jgi:hypothetical protein